MLKDSYNIMTQLLRHIRDWVWVKDYPSGKYILVNDSFCFYSGLSCRDIIGKTDAELWDSPNAMHFTNRDKAVAESKMPILVKEMTPGTHAPSVYIETMKFPIFDEDNNVIAVAGIARDVHWEHELNTYIQQAVQELEEYVEVTK